MRSLLSRHGAFAAAVIRFAGQRIWAASLLVGAGALLDGVGILLLVPLLAVLFGAGTGNGLVATLAAALPGAGQVQRLILLLGLFGGVMALRAVVLWRRDITLGELQTGFIESQRATIAHRLAAARWTTLARIGHGRVTHLMGGDIQRCGAGVYFLFQSSVALVMMLVQLALAFALSPALAAIATALMAAGAAAMSVLTRRSNEIGRGVANANLNLMTDLGRFLTGMKLAMSQNLQGSFVAGFERELAQSRARQIDFQGQQSLVRGLWGLLGAAVAGVTVLIGFAWFHLPAPVLLALLVLLARVSAPAMQIQLGVQQVSYCLSAWESVREMEAELARAAPPPDSGKPWKPEGAIAAEAATYLHEVSGDGDAETGVTGLDLRLEPGEIVGLKGPSGAGKTTLADLLAGLLVPQSGRIAVGSVTLGDDTAASWRSRVAYIAQDAVLFHDTVRRNLLWANPHAGDEALSEALAAAGADRLVARLPQGLETIVGEKGSLISGGERQRLALARALLRKPALLILDEATSAIDVEGERDILIRLRALDPRPTILIIAHRAESLAYCDRMLEMREGRLIGDTRQQAAA